MIRRIAANEHHHFRNDWLSARWHFSFGEYYDPENVSFGPLRVFNDDTVRPKSGFDLHPHREMEIITCVLSGSLEHEDDRGNRGVLNAGDVQAMSAGTGIVHAERNPSADTPLHLVQIWIVPWRRGVTPAYASRSFPPAAGNGVLLPVVSRESKIAGTLGIHQDAFIYLADLAPGQSVDHPLRPARHAYVFQAEGTGAVNGGATAAGDAVRVDDESAVTLAGGTGSRFLLIDLV